jgi:hypothetical protein
MDSDLITYMRNAGFVDIQEMVYWNRGSSIKNWLENSGLPEGVHRDIFEMHLALDEKGKSDYNMIVKDGDCFIDMKFLILLGEKQ